MSVDKLAAELKEKKESNTWDHVDDFIKVLEKVKSGEWHWYKNFDCKYVDLRVDMRDGGCIIRDRKGNRILPEQLMQQGCE